MVNVQSFAVPSVPGQRTPSILTQVFQDIRLATSAQGTGVMRKFHSLPSLVAGTFVGVSCL